MRRATALVVLAYVAALAVALIAGRAMEGSHPVVVALVADCAATIAIFAFSMAFDNSSFYDAYWSVVPLPIALYWAAHPAAATSAPRAQFAARLEIAVTRRPSVCQSTKPFVT